MPIAHVQTAQTNPGTSIYTHADIVFGAPVGSGNMVCGTAVFYNAGGTTSGTIGVVDDKGNVYTLKNLALPDSAFVYHYQFYKENITNGPTTVSVTWDYGVQAQHITLIADEFSNIATSSAFDGSNMTDQATSTSHTAGSVTTTAAGDLIYVGWAIQANAAQQVITPGLGFAVANDNLAAPATFDFNVATHYQIQTAAGAINPACTLAFTKPGAGMVMAFKAAATGFVVTAQQRMSLEILGGVSAQSAAQAEIAGALSARQGSPFESLRAVVGQGRLPAESLRAVVGLEGMAAEIIGAVKSAIVARAEFIGTAFASQARAPLEITASVNARMAARLETMGSVNSRSAAPAESLASVIGRSSAPLESLGALLARSAMRTELTSLVLVVNAIANAPIEILGALRAVSSSPGEVTASVKALAAAVPIEVLRQVTVSARAPVEQLGALRAQARLQIETSGTLKAQMRAAIEWLGSTRSGNAMPLELLASHLITSGSAMRFETLGRLAAQTGIPAEVLSLVVALSAKSSVPFEVRSPYAASPYVITLTGVGGGQVLIGISGEAPLPGVAGPKQVN